MNTVFDQLIAASDSSHLHIVATGFSLLKVIVAISDAPVAVSDLYR